MERSGQVISARLQWWHQRCINLEAIVAGIGPVHCPTTRAHRQLLELPYIQSTSKEPDAEHPIKQCSLRRPTNFLVASCLYWTPSTLERAEIHLDWTIHIFHLSYSQGFSLQYWELPKFLSHRHGIMHNITEDQITHLTAKGVWAWIHDHGSPSSYHIPTSEKPLTWYSLSTVFWRSNGLRLKTIS